MTRAALLAQGGEAAPPVETSTAWELDATRQPAGYTLSDGNQTAINTSGGSNYTRWVPTAKAIQPWDGRRYWEVLCAPGGAATFDGYFGVVSAAQREEFNSGNAPITRGSIGWRGNGTLWSSNTITSSQRLTGLPAFGAGDVLMFVLDPAAAGLWIGKNGLWHSDPISDPATWTAALSPAFYPQLQGRNPGDGGTLRSLASAFSYPLPPGVLALAADLPELRIFEAAAFIEFDWSRWQSCASAAVFLELGGGTSSTTASASLYIELELP